MTTNQPNWKYACYVGDIDPIAYGGGIVYEDTNNIYDPEMVYFEPADDEQWQKNNDNCIVTIYRIVIEKDITKEWFFDKLPELCKFTGQNYEYVISLWQTKTPLHDKAMLYQDLISYFGAYEFDQYPEHMTDKNAYEKYKDELQLMRKV